MEGSAAVSQSQSGNNAEHDVFLDPVREMIDFSQMTVEPISIAAMTALAAHENVNESTTDAPTAGSKRPKKSRAKVATSTCWVAKICLLIPTMWIGTQVRMI